MDLSPLLNFFNNLNGSISQLNHQINDLKMTNCNLHRELDNLRNQMNQTNCQISETRCQINNLTHRVNSGQVQPCENVCQIQEQKVDTPPTIPEQKVESLINIVSGVRNGDSCKFIINSDQDYPLVFTQFSDDGENFGNFNAPFAIAKGDNISIERFAPNTKKFFRLFNLNGSTVISNIFEF